MNTRYQFKGKDMILKKSLLSQCMSRQCNRLSSYLNKNRDSDTVYVRRPISNSLSFRTLSTMLLSNSLFKI